MFLIRNKISFKSWTERFMNKRIPWWTTNQPECGHGLDQKKEHGQGEKPELEETPHECPWQWWRPWPSAPHYGDGNDPFRLQRQSKSCVKSLLSWLQWRSYNGRLCPRIWSIVLLVLRGRDTGGQMAGTWKRKFERVFSWSICAFRICVALQCSISSS